MVVLSLAFLKAGLMHVAEKIGGEDVAEIGESYLEDLAGFFTPYASKAKDRIVKTLRLKKVKEAIEKALKPRSESAADGPRVR